jgi:hypothetical protein
MNAVQNDQHQVGHGQKESPNTTSVSELLKMAQPLGPCGDLVLKFRNGELVAADTGDQGGGQN